LRSAWSVAPAIALACSVRLGAAGGAASSTGSRAGPAIDTDGASGADGAIAAGRAAAGRPGLRAALAGGGTDAGASTGGASGSSRTSSISAGARRGTGCVPPRHHTSRHACSSSEASSAHGKRRSAVKA
jgi:hypothetical protein